MAEQNGCKPPKKTAEMWPMFGLNLFRENLKGLQDHQFLELIRGRYTRNGMTVTSKVLGGTKVTTIEPENIKTILSLRFKDWGLGNMRKNFFVPLLGHGIFTTDGAAWQHSRELLRPNFVRTQVADLDMFERHAAHLIKAIPHNGSTVNLQELFFRLTIDSATEFLFGESTNSLIAATAKSDSDFAGAFNRSQEAIAASARIGMVSKLLPQTQFKKDTKFIHAFIDRYVTSALDFRKDMDLQNKPGDEGRYVFLHELAKRTKDPMQIRSELLNVLLAGRDTTASLLGNVWFTLSKRPDIWKKLQAEVNDVLNGKKPTFAQIKEMKYLKNILHESLRLYPVVPFNSRMAEVDTVLPLGGGPDGKSPLFIKKNQVVSYSIYSLHRRKDYYGEDAEEFKPERWDTLRPGWEYLPFNGGPRICIGREWFLVDRYH